MITDSGYFAAVGLPTVEGRLFNRSDRTQGTMVAIVSVAVAERAWPGQRAVGRRFRLGPAGAPLVEIVGVVGTVRSVSLTDPPTLDVYLPYWQSDMSLYSNAITLVVTTSADSIRVPGAVRLAVRELDPQMPLPAFRTLKDVADASVTPLRVQRNVVVMMAAVALLLASVGICGVVSQTVAQRTKEIGIRKALGAPTGSIERLIVTQLIMPVTRGLAAGMLVTLPLGGWLQSLVFGISPLDPPTLAGTTIVLGVVAVAAAYLPARRATRIHPLAALRVD